MDKQTAIKVLAKAGLPADALPTWGAGRYLDINNIQYTMIITASASYAFSCVKGA